MRIPHYETYYYEESVQKTVIEYDEDIISKILVLPTYQKSDIDSATPFCEAENA